MIRELGLCPLHVEDEDAEVTSAYCGDLLSDVMTHAQPDGAWFTIQSHVNIIAVAQLRDVACVVVVNGIAPDPQTVAKARSQGISLCGSEGTSAELCMALAGKL
jgi:uncharacterized membrane protein